jgi:hypothetical protein
MVFMKRQRQLQGAWRAGATCTDNTQNIHRNWSNYTVFMSERGTAEGLAGTNHRLGEQHTEYVQGPVGTSRCP